MADDFEDKLLLCAIIMMISGAIGGVVGLILLFIFGFIPWGIILIFSIISAGLGLLLYIILDFLGG